MGEAAERLSENRPPNTPPGLIPWKPGQSGNPGGRPKGLASYIREQSMDGRELADFLLAVMRGQHSGFKGFDRLRACEILLNRSFGVQPIIEGDKAIKPILQLDKLTAQELEFLENVRSGLAAIHDRVNSGTNSP